MRMHTDSAPRVTVLDSGVGGLSVCREIVRRVPGVELIYVGDNAAFPYGTRPEGELRERVVYLARHFFERDNPQLLVLACNTASTIALNAVRAAVPIPVVGVVPAIKPAAVHSRTRAIGLLGTPATVASVYTETLIRRFAADCRVVRLGCAKLAIWAEAKMAGQPPNLAAIADAVAPLFDTTSGQPVDTIVLACTHFPWLRPELRSAATRRVTWIDSGRAIAQQVASLLPKAAENQSRSQTTMQFAFTRITPKSQPLVARLQRLGAEQVIVENMPPVKSAPAWEPSVEVDR